MKKVLAGLTVLLATGLLLVVGRVLVGGELKPSDLKDETSQETAEAKELFEEYYARAEEVMREMTQEEKIAQLFLVRFPEASELTEVVAAEPGGFILFAKDFQGETRSSLRAKLQRLQEKSKTGFILGVDEEGGTVTRVSRYAAFRATRFAAPQELYRQGGLELLTEDAREKSVFLKDLEINMNLAPVADVPLLPTSFMYARALGQDAAETARYVGAVVEAMRAEKLISVMKHFPGYGDNVDTHTGVAVDERSYDELKEADFLPFMSGIKAGGPVILVSHNIVAAIDVAKPASLSGAVHEVLRDELGFTGVIMTDDLAMGALKEYASRGEAAVEAVRAGNDLIITSDFLNQKREVEEAVKQGRISEERIDEAVRRVLALKLAYEIME